MSSLSRNVKVYIYFIIIMGALIAGIMAMHYEIPSYGTLLLFIILSIFVESLAIPLPGGGAVSVGYAICLSAMIITGPLGTSICGCLGVMFRYVKLSSGSVHHIANTPLYKTLFNGMECFIAIGITAMIYYSFGMSIKDPLFYTNIIPLLTAIITYVVINTTIMTKLFSMLNNQSFIDMFIKNMKWLLPQCFVVASLGIFISILYLNYGAAIMVLFFGPLLLARYSFKLYLEMKDLYFETVYALTKAVEAKDPYTNGHSQRVADYAEKLAKIMGLKQSRIDTLRTAALLHDIGKIGIQDDILNKPGTLTTEEMNKIKTHPSIGINILSDVDFLSDVREIILKHHEKYDGTGYPDGIGGQEVPIEAYILAVADAFDAMTSDRSYRKGMTTQKALEIIQQDAGSHFHPEVAATFVEMVRKEVLETSPN